MSNTLEGCIKFKYEDNRFKAKKNFVKDQNILVNVDALNDEGVTYHGVEKENVGSAVQTNQDGAYIVNEPEDGDPNGRYYGEYYIRIEGSSLNAGKMKDEIENTLKDKINNLHSVFIH